MTSSNSGGRGNVAPLFSSPPSAVAVEATLATYPLRVPAVQDAVAETAAFPSMTAVFADLCYHGDGYPPRQDAFVDTFAARFATTNPDLFSLFRWPGSQARLERAYPSFVRELHLALLLEELGLICLRDPGADQRHGLDIIVLRGKIAVSLATYIGTSRARAYRVQKLRRHPSTGIVLDVPLDRAAAHQVGFFLLYTRGEAQRIAAEIARLAGDPPRPAPPPPAHFDPPPTPLPWWAQD